MSSLLTLFPRAVFTDIDHATDNSSGEFTKAIFTSVTDASIVHSLQSWRQAVCD